MAEGNTRPHASVPVAWSPPGRRRRSDAERNRERVLAAARQLVVERGIAAVTMDALAAASGVGKGTLYRAFGSRAGLAEALLDDAERQLQGQLLTAAPPLGPGAPPRERLAAFVGAYIDFLHQNVDLLLETERGGQGARFHTGAYGFWHAFVSGLLRAEGRDQPDVRADALLALLSADLYRHLLGAGADRAVTRRILTEAARCL